ncbi:hypothetical protein OG884_30525 [Streptosporangium sp. NBC_01755]|nr:MULTISPECIES: hypothetical protein [unclassified Streptosporangium]WSA29415.1 hypothetical protein OIE13_16950 [Streptosporangium sp. NBC_01810]WSC99141.1 hypothetical protein OG884_30525 [Streptosporangium sp. NBC_01755]
MTSKIYVAEALAADGLDAYGAATVRFHRKPVELSGDKTVVDVLS